MLKDDMQKRIIEIAKRREKNRINKENNNENNKKILQFVKLNDAFYHVLSW